METNPDKINAFAERVSDALATIHASLRFAKNTIPSMRTMLPDSTRIGAMLKDAEPHLLAALELFDNTLEKKDVTPADE